MTAKLYLNKPNRPQGEPTRVGVLGTFENGGVYEVEELEEDLYIPPYQESSAPVVSESKPPLVEPDEGNDNDKEE